MNKIYRVLWSKSRGAYVVASELARSCLKGNTKKSLLVGVTTLLPVFAGGGVQAAFTSNVVNQTVTGEVVSGGTQNVSSGGITISGALSSGNQIISSGGVASTTFIRSNGKQYVSASGLASGSLISSGGSQYVSSGGSAIG